MNSNGVAGAERSRHKGKLGCEQTVGCALMNARSSRFFCTERHLHRRIPPTPSHLSVSRRFQRRSQRQSLCASRSRRIADAWRNVFPVPPLRVSQFFGGQSVVLVDPRPLPSHQPPTLRRSPGMCTVWIYLAGYYLLHCASN